MKKIETLTPEQWAEIPKIRQWWLDNASRQIPKEDSDDAVRLLYELRDLPMPEIINVDSPLGACVLIAAAKRQNQASLRASLRDSLGASLRASLGDSLWASLGDSLRDSLGDSLRASLGDSLTFYYWQGSAGFLDGGTLAGANLDKQKYQTLKKITANLTVIFPYKDVCIVCQNPIYCGWDDQGRIHGEDRAAAEYKDGFKIWALEGYRVPESLVMEAEKQTLEEITNEQNEEIKRIRINRYGWVKYLSEANAEILDIATPKSGSWMESLMKCDGFTVLCTFDPSTGRPYSLEVDPEIKTCEAAQKYLLAPDIALNGLGIDCVKNYPLVRT